MQSNNLLDFFNQYELKAEVKQKINITKNKEITSQTLKVYKYLHPEFDDIYLKVIKAPLQKIYKNEQVVKFENTNIYFHTYRILNWIFQYIEVLDYFQSDLYKKHSFAKHKSATSKFKRDYKKNRKEVANPSNVIKKDNRVNSFVLRKYIRHRELMDIYFNSQTLFPIANINYEAFEEINENIILIQHLQKYYSSSYIDSENVIYESLAIIIHGYFTIKMGVDSKYANERTNEIVYNLFNYESEKTGSNRLANIYIAGRINNIPIFKNHKTSDIYSESLKQQFIELLDEAKKDFSDFENTIPNSTEYFNTQPLKAFFEQYPMEFLSKLV